PTFLKVFQTIIMTQLRLLENVIVFHRRQSFDMKIRAMGFTSFKKLGIKFQILFGNYATRDMYFCHWFAVIFPDNFHHRIDVHFPTVLTLLDETGIRAELAVVYTYIRWFDMKIAIEIRTVAVLLFTDIVCQDTEVT